MQSCDAGAEAAAAALLPQLPPEASLLRLLAPTPAALCLLLLAAALLRVALFVHRRARASSALRAAGLSLVAWRPALPWRLYRSSRRSLLDAVRARARATGRSAFGAAACGVSRQLSRCALSALTAPAPRAGAVVGEHAFVHVACPALARAALAGGATKAPFSGAVTGFVGEGLFTAEGDDWRVPRSCPLRQSRLLGAQSGTLR